MADDCSHSGDGCCTPPPPWLPEPRNFKAAALTSCDAACGCHDGVPASMGSIRVTSACSGR